MKASIIITTYNRPVFLERAIASVLGQKTDFQFEVIIIDDNGLGSDLQKKTESIIPKNLNITYFPLKINSGACIARNRGAELATGEFLFFLDDDDEFLPNKLHEQITFLEHNIEYDGCLAAFKRIGQNGNEILADSNYPVVGDFKNFVLRGNFFTPMLCIRKISFFKSSRFIDIPRFQDRFYMMNALKQSFRFATLQKQLHIMYEHCEDRITSKSVNQTKMAISQINTWINQYYEEFSEAECEEMKYNSLSTIAVTRYNALSRIVRISSSISFFKLFLMKKRKSDFLLIIKSLIK